VLEALKGEGLQASASHVSGHGLPARSLLAAALVLLVMVGLGCGGGPGPTPTVTVTVTPTPSGSETTSETITPMPSDGIDVSMAPLAEDQGITFWTDAPRYGSRYWLLINAGSWAIWKIPMSPAYEEVLPLFINVYAQHVSEERPVEARFYLSRGALEDDDTVVFSNPEEISLALVNANATQDESSSEGMVNISMPSPLPQTVVVRIRTDDPEGGRPSIPVVIAVAVDSVEPL
jgi:hypothetical protein